MASWYEIIYARAMDSLKDMLAKKDLEKPSDIVALEDYVRRFNFAVRITPGQRGIGLIVDNGKDAYIVRAHLAHIEAYAAPTKKLYIRVGS
jgi:hypothetical protein